VPLSARFCGARLPTPYRFRFDILHKRSAFLSIGQWLVLLLPYRYGDDQAD